MSRDLVIFGTGQISEIAHFYFTHDSGMRVVAFTVDRAYLGETRLRGLPVVPFDELAASFGPSTHRLFVAMSYSGINRARADRCRAARDAGYELVSYISSRATVWSGFDHGDNCLVLEDNTIQPFARLGANVTLWSGNHIGHHSVIEDDVFISSHVVISGNVEIGARSFVGVNVTIRDGVRIGADNVLGAGSLILHDTADGSVFGPKQTEKSRVPSRRLKGI